MIDCIPPAGDAGPEAEPNEKKSTEYPLFPRAMSETGPDNRRFARIQILPYLPDEMREVCPKKLQGSELTSWNLIIDAFGGDATYQLGGMGRQIDSKYCGIARTFQLPLLSPRAGGCKQGRQRRAGGHRASRSRSGPAR